MNARETIVTVVLTISEMPNLITFLMVDIDANCIGKASDAKSLMHISSFATPTSFRRIESNSKYLIEAGEDPPINWYL
jgi:hypothetical protein